MAIEGPLRELGIHDVFQLLDLSRKTGVLRVTSELRHNAGTILFEGGAIIFAEIRSNPHRLGALLLRTGKITEADLERARDMRSEEHTSELQSPCNLVCRLLLEKKKKNTTKTHSSVTT